MKHTLKLFRRIAAAVSGAMLVAVAATSCVSDETQVMRPGARNGNGNDNTEVLLRLRTPGGFATPAASDGTRAALTFAQENAVNDVWVLAVDEDEDKIVAIAKGRNPDFDPNADYDGPDEYDGSAGNTDTNSGSGTFAVDLPGELKGETVKLVVLANAEDILEEADFIFEDGEVFAGVGMSYTGTGNARASLIGNLRKGEVGEIVNSIPMWGEAEITVSPSASPTITLTRAVARLDVGLGTPSYDETEEYPWSWDGLGADGDDADTDPDPIPFELTGVEVNSRTNQYYLIPELDADGNPILSQMGNTAERTTYFYEDDEDFITNGDYTTQNIYLPESGAVVNIANPTMNDADHNSRTYIIVKGIYTGDNPANTTPTYYRLDFADEDGNLLDILRNHLYRFNITNVDGPGYAYIDNARTSRPMNMTARIVVVDESEFDNVVFDEQYYLAVSPREIVFTSDGAVKSGADELKLLTDYPRWNVTKGSAYWLTLGDLAGTGNNGVVQVIDIAADQYVSTTADREAVLTITAGRLTAEVKVTQERKHVPGVKAVQGVIGYIWNPGGEHHLELTLDGDKDYYGNGPGELRSVQDDYTVYVAYFKFGSLVATSSQNTGEFTSADIVAWPTLWAADRTAMESEIGTVIGSTSWTNVPVSAKLTTVGATIATDLANGLGDPCDYWFGDGDGDGATATATENWRLPTAKEYTVFVGGDPTDTTWQNWAPGDGNYSWLATTGAGSGTRWPYYYNAEGVATTTAGDFAAPASGRFPVAAQTGRAAFSEVLPAAGYRTPSGEVYYQGGRGYYRSSTAFSGTSACSLYFFSSNLYPSNYLPYAGGYAVRCVPPPILKVLNAPTPFYGVTPAQEIEIESNVSWSVSENIEWLKIVGATTGHGNGSFTLKVEDGIDDVERLASSSWFAPGKVTVTNGTTTIELDVSFLWGGYDDILYFDHDDDNRLKIGKWAPAGLRTVANPITEVNQLAFFKFGSVVGFTGANVDWNTDYILFNPTQYVVGNHITDFVSSASLTASTWGNIVNTSTANALPNIPGYNPAVDGSGMDISSPDYNNYDNVSIGKGDPCQLVGLTADQIKAAGAAGFQALLDGRPGDYKGWRMPTARENISFAGESDPVYGGDWVNWKLPDSRSSDIEIPGPTNTGYPTAYDFWHSGNPPYGAFPSQSQGGYAPHGSQILPVVGIRLANHRGLMEWVDPNPIDRDKDGDIDDMSYYSQNFLSNFWSSTIEDPDKDGTAYTIGILELKTVSEDPGLFSSGNMVRCVR